MNRHVDKTKQPKWVWIVFSISIVFFLASMCAAPKTSTVNTSAPVSPPVTITVPVPYTVTVPATTTTYNAEPTTTTTTTNYYLPETENQNVPDVDVNVPRKRVGTWYPCVPGSKGDRDNDGKCGE